MSIEACLIYLAALAAFCAPPPETCRLPIMSDSLRHGVRRSLWTVAGDLPANAVSRRRRARRLGGLTGRGINRISGMLMIGAAGLLANCDPGVSTR